MTSKHIATIASGRNDALLSFADSIVDFTTAGGTIDELRTVIADASKPARKAQARKTVATIDPTVGSGASMREVNGRMMPATAGSITDKQVDRITKFFTVKQIVKVARKLGFAGQSLRTLSVADGSELYAALKAAK